MADRAILFVDGNNWYHSLREIGLRDLGRLDYSAISLKLVGPREWLETRYYIGQVKQTGDTTLYAAQRRFLAKLSATDNRVTYHLGRLETRTVKNEAAEEVKRYLSNLRVRIDMAVYHELMGIAQEHSVSEVMVEKAVDVMLAVDMVVMAERDKYDAAYLLSADGDYTPAVKAAKSLGKKVYAVSPTSGAQLAAVVDSFIRVSEGWFEDCYESSSVNGRGHR